MGHSDLSRSLSWRLSILTPILASIDGCILFLGLAPTLCSICPCGEAAIFSDARSGNQLLCCMLSRRSLAYKDRRNLWKQVSVQVSIILRSKLCPKKSNLSKHFRCNRVVNAGLAARDAVIDCQFSSCLKAGSSKALQVSSHAHDRDQHTMDVSDP